MHLFEIIKKELLAIVLATALLLPAVGLAQVTESDDAKVTSKEYVLIINCHLEEVSWVGNFEDAVIKYLKTTKQAEVYSEHVKALGINSRERYDEECQRLLNKYVNRPQAIIFIGPAAWVFFAELFDNQWKEVPIIRCVGQDFTVALDDMFKAETTRDMVIPNTEADMKARFNVTGIWAHTKIKETVELLRQTMPELNHIAFISDERIGSQVLRHRMKLMMANDFPDISVDYLASKDLTTNEMLDRVASYDQRTGILFHSWAMEGDRAEDYYITNNLYKLIGGASHAPVLTFWDMNVEEGYVAGGYYNRLSDMSNEVVNLLKRVLAGENARLIPFVHVNKERAYLNYANLRNYHLSTIDYPKDAIYFDRPENPFYKYRYAIGFFLLIVLGVLVYTLQRIYFLNRVRAQQKRELQQQMEFQSEISLRNFKLALALDVSTVNPWVWNLRTDILEIDDVKRMIDNPNGTDVSFSRNSEEVFDTIHPDERDSMRAIIRSLRNGKANYLKQDCRIKRSNETEYKWYMLQAVVYERDNRGKPQTLIGATTLINESKQLELELRQAKERAEESNRLKSAFLANLSHEIRTPLNAIVGFSGVLATTEDEDQKRELAQIVQHNNTLLLRLINDIIELSKIESGAVEFKYTNFELNAELLKLRDKFEGETAPDVKLIFEPAMDKCLLRTERPRVMQVIQQFLSNAVKFTQKGEIHFGYYPAKEGRLRFFVKDTGCGIPQEQLQAVFGRFVKLNTFKQGTGLGLSVCQIIADKMDADIGVYSNVGVGSEFWFEIHYNPVAEEDLLLGEDGAAAGGKSKILVLIAEDSQSNYIMLRTMLESDYSILHAWDGKEAVDLFKKFKPDIILMDVMMPVVDGYAATAEIRKLSQSVPIIAITANGFDDDVIRMTKRGFSAYEPKPVDSSKLRKAITEFIANNKKA